MSHNKDTLRAGLIRALLRLMAALPFSLGYRLGGLLGWLLYRLAGKTVRVTRRNIELCFPQLPATEQENLVKQTVKESTRTLLELGALWLWQPERTFALVREISGGERLRQALDEKKGVIIVAPHLGAWEMIGVYLATLAPITSLYRPPRIAPLDDLIRSARQRTGATLVPTDARGVRALLQALSRGEQVGILPDQDPGFGNGVFAPFFGIQTNTMTLLSRLASKSQAPAFVSYAERLDGGRGYHLHFVPVGPALNSNDALASITALNQAIESCVRSIPAQYQWTYKRFKTRPEGEKSLY